MWVNHREASFFHLLIPPCLLKYWAWNVHNVYWQANLPKKISVTIHWVDLCDVSCYFMYILRSSLLTHGFRIYVNSGTGRPYTPHMDSRSKIYSSWIPVSNPCTLSWTQDLACFTAVAALSPPSPKRCSLTGGKRKDLQRI